MLARQLTDRFQPVIEKPGAFLPHGRVHAAAAVMAADDDMAHLEHLDGELQHRQTIHIRRLDKIGDVAMDEHLAGIKTGDDVRRHPAIGAADP